MKIAILGGSFNPLHIGHAMMADTVIKELGYDKVLFVPTCVPPHKELSSRVTTAQRFEMVQRFCKNTGDDCFEAESCEIDRGGVSYTIDTVKYIIQKYGSELEDKPALLMGEEIASQFEKWYCPDEIADLCHLIIFPRMMDYSKETKEDFHNRPAGNYEEDYKKPFNKESFKYECTVLEKGVLPVSSTDIRERVFKGQSFKYLVPAAVFDYILEKDLYKNIDR